MIFRGPFQLLQFWDSGILFSSFLVQLSCIEAIAFGMTPLIQPVIQLVSSPLSARSPCPARGTEENIACTADPFNTFPRDARSFLMFFNFLVAASCDQA